MIENEEIDNTIQKAEDEHNVELATWYLLKALILIERKKLELGL